MKVTVIGPNLMDQRLGQFHVHAANCADIARDPKRYGYAYAAPHMDFECESVRDVAECVYGDHMAENPPESEWSRPDAYLSDFHFAPCTDALRD
jgi:hypothetical protein